MSNGEVSRSSDAAACGAFGLEDARRSEGETVGLHNYPMRIEQVSPTGGQLTPKLCAPVSEQAVRESRESTKHQFGGALVKPDSIRPRSFSSADQPDATT